MPYHIIHSADKGATFSDPVEIGEAGSARPGLDVHKVEGLTVLGGTDETVMRGEADETVFTEYGTLVGDGQFAGAVFIPTLKTGTSQVNPAAVPDVLVGSTEEGEAETLWIGRMSGTVIRPISPVIDGEKGRVIDPRCVYVADYNTRRIAGLFEFADGIHLMVSTDGGQTWTDRGLTSAEAMCLVMRKRDDQGKELYYTDGDPMYSSDFGATAEARPLPDNVIARTISIR